MIGDRESCLPAIADSQNDQTDRGNCQTIFRLVPLRRTMIPMMLNWSGLAFCKTAPVQHHENHCSAQGNQLNIRLIPLYRTMIPMNLNWSGLAFSAKGAVPANQMNSK